MSDALGIYISARVGVSFLQIFILQCETTNLNSFSAYFTLIRHFDYFLHVYILILSPETDSLKVLQIACYETQQFSFKICILLS